jgi:hypothetical protein
MKAKREFLDYLQDIKEALEKLEEFTRGMDFEDFSKDNKTTFGRYPGFRDYWRSRKKDSQILPLAIPGCPLAGYGRNAG